MSLPTVRTAGNNHGHAEGTRVNRHAEQCCMMYDAMTLPILMSTCPPLRPDKPTFPQQWNQTTLDVRIMVTSSMVL